MENEAIQQMYTALRIFFPCHQPKWIFCLQHNFQVWRTEIRDDWKKTQGSFYLEIYLESKLELL